MAQKSRKTCRLWKDMRIIMKIQLSDHFSYNRLLRFVAPSILMLLCTSVYSIVDGFFVSNYVGKTPFAALNLVMPVLMGVGTLGFMAGTGGSAVVSMTLGEGRKELANEYFSLIVYVTLAVSIVVGCICFALAPQIALALGADGELEADCVRYSRILFLSSPAFVMQYLFQSFFIAAEKPTLSLKVNVIAGLTNAVLDYVLIVAFPLGLVGAALATAAGQLVGGIIPVIYFSRENGSLLQLGKAKWHGKVIWQTVTNGSSELVTNISTSIAPMTVRANSIGRPTKPSWKLYSGRPILNYCKKRSGMTISDWRYWTISAEELLKRRSVSLLRQMQVFQMSQCRQRRKTTRIRPSSTLWNASSPSMHGKSVSPQTHMTATSAT